MSFWGREKKEPTAGDALLAQWRSHIARALFLALGLTGTALLINYHAGLALFTAVSGWALVLSFLLASRIKAPPPALGGGMVALACGHAGTMAMWSGQDTASGIIWFLLAVVLTTVLSDWQAGAAILAVCTGIFAAEVWAELHHIHLLPFTAEITEQERLVGNVVTFAIAGVVIVLSQGFLIGRLRRALSERMETLQRQEGTSRERERALIELQQAHEDMRQTQAQLVIAGKAELLGRLAAGIAHDMNNALTVVLGEAELLKDSDPASASAISEAVGHVSHLTRQLLALGRKDLVRPEPLALDRCLDQAAQVLRRTLPTDITLLLEAEEQVVIYADGHQIQQVLLNLATNAAHAMPKGGTMTLGLGSTPDHARLFVRDTGVGMTQETQARIFEPFFSTKEEGVGTGLGLASVRAIVEQLGGTIECHSRPSQGTEFVVELPLHRGDTPVNIALQSIRPQLSLEGAEILVVEDDDDVRSVITSALLSAGAHVLEAGDPKAGVLKTEQVVRDFDVLCTDVVMPEGGGGQMIEWFQARYPQAEIVICTGYSDDELLRRDIAQGRFLLLRKPFTRQELLNVCDLALVRTREKRSVIGQGPSIER